MQFREQVLHTTSAAQNLLLAQALQPHNPTFVVGQFLRLIGTLDVDRLAGAIDATLGALDVASARFTLDESGASMTVGHEVPATRILDVSTAETPERAAQAWAQTTHATAIDPATEPCVRATLLILGPQTHLFHLAAHHAALDAFGIALLMRRISDVHAGAEPAVMSAAALIDEDENYRSSAQFEIDRDFWAAQLEGAPEAASLAREERPRPESSTIAAAIRTHRVMLAATTVDAAKNVAADAGANWSEVLPAAIAGFLARATGRDELILGFPTMARMGSAASRMPTTSVNVVPLRLVASRASSALEVVERFRQARAAITRHSRYRGEDILRTLRSNGSSPVVGPSINIKPFGARLQFAGLDASVESLARGPVTDLSITAQFIERTGEVELVIDADAQRYTDSELTAIAGRLREFVDLFCSSDPTGRLGRLPAITVAEATGLPIAGPTGATSGDVLQAIRQIASATPDAPALTSGEITLTYGELIAETNRLATRLRRLGVVSGDTVALLLPRAPVLIVALLATLTSGAAYVPLDPRFPADRLEHMLGHSRPKTILTTGEFVGMLSVTQAARALALDSLDGDGTESTGGPGVETRVPGSTAYVIYTSGSTGRPKGVAIGDRAMSNLVRDMSTRFGLGRATVMLAVTTVSFDIAVLELFAPLIAGGRVVLASNAEIQDPRALAGLIDRHGVNVLQATPALWSGLLEPGDEIDLAGVDALVGGEPLPAAVAAELTVRARSVWNMYGPTETTVWSTVAGVHSGDDITIGTPVSNTRTYVLDAALGQVPVGSIGELYIAGAGVADGYVGQPGLTATRFVAEPGHPGHRMYRTGDLARWRADGRLDCLGRTDDQVKVRGFRVELGDVEAAVAALAGIGRCVARVMPTATGGRLVAYVQADPEIGVDPAVIREQLRDRLPEYMIPAAVVEVSEYPHTPNGKLDRKALPDPDFRSLVGSGRAPTTEIETTLCAVVAEVLDLPRVGVDDDFFVLGGDSIAAVRVVGAAARRGIELSVAAVFDSRTVAVLSGSAVLREASANTGSTKPDGMRGARVLPETAMLAGLSQDELDDFEDEGSLL